MAKNHCLLFMPYGVGSSGPGASDAQAHPSLPLTGELRGLQPGFCASIPPPIKGTQTCSVCPEVMRIEAFSHQNLQVRGGAMTQRVNCSLQGREDLSSAAWHPHKSQSRNHIPNPHYWGRGRQIPGACWTATMDIVKTGSSTFGERETLSQIQSETRQGKTTPHPVHRHSLQFSSENTQRRTPQGHCTVVRWQNMTSLVKLSYMIKSLEHLCLIWSYSKGHRVSGFKQVSQKTQFVCQPQQWCCYSQPLPASPGSGSHPSSTAHWVYFRKDCKVK